MLPRTSRAHSAQWCARRPMDRRAKATANMPGVRRLLILALGAFAVSASPAVAADHGITLTSSRALSPRLTELTMSTAALAKPTHVRVLVPAGYDANRSEERRVGKECRS